ncbi:MAG: hypothetical protein Alpg2KO_23800 [Alphaproteobacteria bacterium]
MLDHLQTVKQTVCDILRPETHIPSIGCADLFKSIQKDVIARQWTRRVLDVHNAAINKASAAFWIDPEGTSQIATGFVKPP